MDKEILSIDELSELLGQDTMSKSRYNEVIRARQGAWLYLFVKGLSYSKIGKMFNYSRYSISRGVDRFEDLRKEGDRYTLEIWDKLTPYI